MAELKITDLIDKKEIEQVKLLGAEIERVKATYISAAQELARGLKINVEVVGDLDKLNAIIVTQSKKAGDATNDLNAALKKQSELVERVAKSLDEQVKSGNLSAVEMKRVADAGKKNAESLEKLAKAEATVEKAQRASNTTRRSANVSEQERQKIIADAISMTNREIHSIQEANDMNKQLRKAVKLVRDTDEEYIKTVGRLNSTIGVNTDYVKRNSDRYTQQKMTIGDYTESVKRAWMEIHRGNSAMKSMGIIANSTGDFLKSSFNSGVKQVTVGVGTMIKGMVGAQAVIGGIQQLFSLFKQGLQTAIDFEAANSKLAAILGTTAKNTKQLQMDARELGATTKYTAAEATNLQIELAKLGFTAREIKDSTGYILRFAQATGAELSEAAALSGAALRMFGADTKETERYVSSMAVATTKSALSFSYLATALPIVGPVANAFNFTIEDTLALLGKLSDAGFDASMSATATRNILLNLADSGGKLAQALGKPVKSLPELVEGLKMLKDKGVDLNTTLELTDKRSVAAFNAFLTAADKIVPLREQITGVEKELKDTADTMDDNVAGAIKSLSSAWDELMLTINEGDGWMRAVIDWCTKLVRGLSEVLASVDTLQGRMTLNNEKTAVDEAKKANIVETYEKRISDSVKRYMLQGISEIEAQQTARKSYIDGLSQNVKKEEDIISEAEKRRKEIQEKTKWYNKAYLHEVKDGVFKTYSEMELEQAEIISKAKGNIAKYNYVIDEIKSPKVDLTATSTSNITILTDKEKKALEKAAKEKLKIEQDLEDSKISLIDEGLEKELAKIAQGYNKKIAAIKGNSKEEKELIGTLGKQMQKEVTDFTESYNIGREKKDITNHLATVQKDTQEELDLKMKMLELEREEEINAAEKSGESVFSIDEKYLKKRQELQEGFASKQIQMIAENAAAEQVIRDMDYKAELLALQKKKELKEITPEQFAEEEYKIKVDYARKTVEAAIDALEMELSVKNMNAAESAKINEEIQKKKAELVNEEAQLEIEAIKRVTKADDEARKKREKNLQHWLQSASQIVGAINDFVGTLYDGQIDMIEKESEANNEAHEAEIVRIDRLKEQKVITQEEAEARKRAAEDKTRKKEEELAKKKADLQTKQASFEKANSITQAMINTAASIVATSKMGFPQAIPFIAMAAALGAIQLATIVATPIPKYAKGTREGGHTGGLAFVGDGGKNEVVLVNGRAWVTPDIPTLVDLPRGAEVIPEITSPDWNNISLNLPAAYFAQSRDSRQTVVVNDYKKLESKMDRTNYLLLQSIKQQHKDAYDLNYERYKKDRL